MPPSPSISCTQVNICNGIYPGTRLLRRFYSFLFFRPTFLLSLSCHYIYYIIFFLKVQFQENMNFEFMRTLHGFINFLQVLFGFAALFACSFIWRDTDLYFQFIYRVSNYNQLNLTNYKNICLGFWLAKCNSCDSFLHMDLCSYGVLV